jgi:hypothetical protein
MISFGTVTNKLIPKNVLKLVYESPQVAGVVNMHVLGTDPNGVKSKNSLRASIIINTLGNPFQSGEDPGTSSASHWHVEFDKK